MDQQLQTIHADLLLSLVPADGSAVGNQALRRQFLDAAMVLGHQADDRGIESLKIIPLED